MSAFLSVDLLTDFCGILFNIFYRLEIHSLMVCIFDRALNCCTHGQRNYVLVYCGPSTVPSL